MTALGKNTNYLILITTKTNKDMENSIIKIENDIVEIPQSAEIWMT